MMLPSTWSPATEKTTTSVGCWTRRGSTFCQVWIQTDLKWPARGLAPVVKEGGHPIHHHHLSICLSFFSILHFTGQRSIATRAVNFCLILLCRYNARGFDLNRNFPDYFKQNTKRLQPETEAYKEWIAKIQFTLSAGLHAGALVASYPFDNTPNSGKSSSPVSIVTTYIQANQSKFQQRFMRWPVQKFTKRSRRLRHWRQMMTSSIIWRPRTHAITLPCTKEWRASPARPRSPTGRPTEPPGIRWRAELRTIRTSGRARWRSPSKWPAASTRRHRNCPSTGANIGRPLSALLARPTEECAVSFSTGTAGRWRTSPWKSKGATLRFRQRNTANSGASFCPATIALRWRIKTLLIKCNQTIS